MEKFLLYTTKGKKGARLSLFIKDDDGNNRGFYGLDITTKCLKQIVEALGLVAEPGEGILQDHVYYESKPKTNG